MMTPGTRLYAIGDIHGRADLLDQLHEKILADAAGYDGTKRVIYLGDYVDRGMESREVVERLLEGLPAGYETICLRGNHEQAMLDFLDHPENTAGWLNYGGLATLLSYGVRLDHPPYAGDLPAIAGQLAERLPEHHRAFMEQLPLYHQEGSYLFVHAGIRPGVSLEQQHPDDLLWIREDFIGHAHAHEYIVVHGHSISEEAELLPHRVGIDTGACVSGVLTSLVLEGSEQRLIQTGR
jgi:serine/threonine protein phosphatase 1